MPIDDWYKRKIINYSQMQYGMLHCNELDFRPNELGFEFCNMGMIVLNCQKVQTIFARTNTKRVSDAK